MNVDFIEIGKNPETEILLSVENWPVPRVGETYFPFGEELKIVKIEYVSCLTSEGLLIRNYPPYVRAWVIKTRK